MKLRIVKILHILISSFEPINFVAGMGIGITSGIMYNFPIDSIRKGMKYVGIVYFYINLVVVIINHILFILKYFLLPKIKPIKYNTDIIDLMRDTNLSVFMGASTMSVSTLINMLYYMKNDWVTVIKVFWWINLFQCLSCILIVFFFILSNNTDLEKLKTIDFILPTLLLPLVTSTVTSATGSLIMFNDQIYMYIICLMLWSIAIITSFLILSVIFVRLLLNGIPNNIRVFTMFIPIGVMGQGSFSIMNLLNKLDYYLTIKSGKFGKLIINENNNGLLTIISLIISLILISFGIILTIWGLFSIIYWIKFNNYKIPYWIPTLWAATFPFGTMVLASNEFFKITDLIGFKILAIIYAWIVILITTYCMVCTFLFTIPWKRMYEEML